MKKQPEEGENRGGQTEAARERPFAPTGSFAIKKQLIFEILATTLQLQRGYK